MYKGMVRHDKGGIAVLFLVHIYREIDNEKLYKIITEDLDDVELFLSEIRDFMGKI